MGSRSATGDLAAGAVLLVVASVGGWTLFADPLLVSEDYGSDPGPGLLPRLLLALLAAGALGLIVTGALRLRSTTPGLSGGAWRGFIVPTLLVATMLIYSQTLVPLGFLPTTLVFAVFWTILFGIQEWGAPRARSSFLRVVEGLAITGGVYVVFAWLIKIPLP